MLIRQKNNVRINKIDQKNIDETVGERIKMRERRSTPQFKRSEALRRKRYKNEMKSKPGDYTGLPYLTLNE